MGTITSIWLPKKISTRGVAANARQITVAGTSLSFLFQAWGVQLNTPAAPQTMAATLTISAPLVLTAKERLIGFSAILRGFSAVSRAGSVSVVGYLGDARRDFQRGASVTATDDISTENVEIAFVSAKEAFLPAKKRSHVLKIGLVFYAERIDSQNVASVTMDSIDIAALVVAG